MFKREKYTQGNSGGNFGVGKTYYDPRENDWDVYSKESTKANDNFYSDEFDFSENGNK